jgi:hypothetical protein
MSGISSRFSLWVSDKCLNGQSMKACMIEHVLRKWIQVVYGEHFAAILHDHFCKTARLYRDCSNAAHTKSCSLSERNNTTSSWFQERMWRRYPIIALSHIISLSEKQWYIHFNSTNKEASSCEVGIGFFLFFLWSSLLIFFFPPYSFTPPQPSFLLM